MRYSILLLCLFFSVNVFGQSEFETYDNGLIYSPKAMKSLGELVRDSNDRFQACPLDKEYLSWKQTKGYSFEVNGKSLKQVRKYLKQGVSLQDFLDAYKLKVDKQQLLVMNSYDYEGERTTQINVYPGELRFNLKNSHEIKTAEGYWFVKSGYKSVKVLFVKEHFNAEVIPQKYARRIQYVDCLIDTTSTIYLKSAKEFSRSWTDNTPVEAEDLYNYIDQKFNKKPPVTPEDYSKLTDQEIEAVFEALDAYDKEKEAFVASQLADDPVFIEKLESAYNEAAKSNTSNDLLEGYLAKYWSKAKALELKRSRKVYGMCSQDNSPRIHAMNIAQLSAEAQSWDIFLRAHLDIMNDNFQRMSDGSYAYGGRKTYIRELEELDINVTDLLLGVSLRSSSVSENHYYGNIGRLGRAISESEDRTRFEQEMLNAIADNELDDFNRLISYFLYANYQYYLNPEEEQQPSRKAAIEEANALLPDYLQYID